MLECRLQQELREAIDWLISRGYALSRPGGQVSLTNGRRCLVVAGGRLVGGAHA